MCLFLCDFSSVLCIHVALQLCIISKAHDLAPTFNARNYSQNCVEITLLRSFRRIIPAPFTYSLFLLLLPYQNIPALSALSGNFYHETKSEIQKEEGHVPHFLHLQHQILRNKVQKHPGYEQG